MIDLNVLFQWNVYYKYLSAFIVDALTFNEAEKPSFFWIRLYWFFFILDFLLLDDEVMMILNSSKLFDFSF